jgi:hypothetical protein
MKIIRPKKNKLNVKRKYRFWQPFEMKSNNLLHEATKFNGFKKIFKVVFHKNNKHFNSLTA